MQHHIQLSIKYNYLIGFDWYRKETQVEDAANGSRQNNKKYCNNITSYHKHFQYVMELNWSTEDQLMFCESPNRKLPVIEISTGKKIWQ